MTNTQIDEIADGIYRLSTFVSDVGPTGFTFNQFLIDDDEPLLFHTGQRMLFDSVSEAIATVGHSINPTVAAAMASSSRAATMSSAAISMPTSSTASEIRDWSPTRKMRSTMPWSRADSTKRRSSGL